MEQEALHPRSTPDGEAALKNVMLRFRPQGKLLILNEAQRANQPLASLPMSRMVLNGWDRLYEANQMLDAIKRHAVWSWGSTDDQIRAASLLEHALGDMHLQRPLAANVTTLHLIAAALAPGSQNSSFVLSLSDLIGNLIDELKKQDVAFDKSQSVIPVLFDRVETLEALQSDVFDVVAQEVRKYTITDTVEISYVKANSDDYMEKFLGETSSLTRLRVEWLQYIGHLYLMAFLQERGNPSGSDVVRKHINAHSSEIPREEQGKVAEGARILLEQYCEPLGYGLLHGEDTPYTRGERLPLGLLLSLPSFDVNRLGEFATMVEEYNLEWAVAGFDWEGDRG